MPRKKARCKQCGDFREIVGFDLCLKCYSQKRRDDLRDGIPPFVLSPDASQRRDRHDMATQRSNLAKILAVLEGRPIDEAFLPIDRKRQISAWLIEAIDSINATVRVSDSCRDNSENEVVETTEEAPKPNHKSSELQQLLLEPDSPAGTDPDNKPFVFQVKPRPISGDARQVKEDD